MILASPPAKAASGHIGLETLEPGAVWTLAATTSRGLTIRFESPQALKAFQVRLVRFRAREAERLAPHETGWEGLTTRRKGECALWVGPMSAEALGITKIEMD